MTDPVTPDPGAYPANGGGPPATPLTRAPGHTSVDGARLVLDLPGEAICAIAEAVAELLEARFAAAREPREDRWMDAREAAEHLGLSVDALHRLTARRERGGIPFGQDTKGGKLWFLRSELDEWRRDGGR